MFNSENADRRREFVENAASIGLEPTHVRKVVVVAKNIDDDTRSYDIIALFNEDEEHS